MEKVSLDYQLNMFWRIYYKVYCTEKYILDNIILVSDFE